MVNYEAVSESRGNAQKGVNYYGLPTRVYTSTAQVSQVALKQEALTRHPVTSMSGKKESVVGDAIVEAKDKVVEAGEVVREVAKDTSNPTAIAHLILIALVL